MHVAQANVNGNPNVGLYLYANDNYCLAGIEVSESLSKIVEKVLKVPVYRVSICGTSFTGVFCAGNNSCLLLPNIVLDAELSVLKKLNIVFRVISTDLTALGNNILCNDAGALVNPDLSARAKKSIREALGVNLVPGTIADLPTVGSLGVMNDKGCLLHMDAEDTELAEDLFEVPCETGTVNKGNPYVRSAICANTNGFVISDDSGGPEVNWVDEVLGFLGKE
jgi:translation initiation factor 6